MAQRYDDKGFVEVCVFDDGLTIAGNINSALGTSLGGLEAIQKAVDGLSTKSGKERGTGLQNIVKLVLNGMEGEILIVSGDGMLYSNISGAQGYNLKDPNTLKGTLVALRFPIQQREVNLYEIIK